MFGDQKKYVTVDSGNIDNKASYSVEKTEDAATATKEAFESAAGITVTHNLSSIAEGAAGSLLVVGFGNQAKGAVRACAQIQCEDIWVTGTEDKKRGFSFSGAAQVAMLGKTFDQRLFSNTYAILSAVHECGAGALLIVNEAAAEDELLSLLAYQEGLALYVPLEGDKTFQLWVQVLPREELLAEKANYQVEWSKCPVCKLTHDKHEVLANHGICPTCHGLYRLTSDERIAETFDEGSFEEWNTGIPETDPLSFPDFDALIEKTREKSGLEEAVRCGKASIVGMPVAFCVMEATFMMGSMGMVVGEKITRTIERATAERLPLVIFSASGGARMQEGLCSLMQMAKISAAVERHGEAGLPYISVITDPTTGGVTASFAMLGDVIVSEPHALIGFAGRRVIQDTIKQTLPEGFQTAEFALEHGLIDAIVERKNLRAYLAQVIALHMATVSVLGSDGAGVQAGEGALYEYAALEKELNAPLTVDPSVVKDAEHANHGDGLLRFFARNGKAGLNAAAKIFPWLTKEDASASIKRALDKRGVADAPGVKPLKEKDIKNQDASKNPAWESVLLARNVHRPTAQYYIDSMVDGFLELHGDRAFADDGAILAGIGWIAGQPVTILAEEKGADLQQRIKRNFGCPQPEGYRKTMRLMKQAEKFGRPIVCLVDTQGAFCGMEAEERGQGNAIAENLAAMSALKVPVVCIVLGEGGSGGALALAVGNRVAMQEHAVYSVLSPEGFASILWKDRSRAAEAAAVMKMSAAEACELGLIEEVLPEGDAGEAAHETPEVAARNVEGFIVRSLRELSSLSADELKDDRYRRFRAF